jgi:hypothetical protein
MPQAGKIERFFFDFLKKVFSTKCEIFLTASPHFSEKLQTNIAAIGGGTLFSISPKNYNISIFVGLKKNPPLNFKKPNKIFSVIIKYDI